MRPQLDELSEVKLHGRIYPERARFIGGTEGS